MALTLVAAYDVASDARRARLAALLQVHGNRVQRSVFVLEIDEAQLRALRERAIGIMDLDHDSLYFFRQCASCWAGVECIGQADAPTRALYWAVL